VVESPSLDVFKNHLDVVLGDMIQWRVVRVRVVWWVVVGLNGLRGLFQPERLYDVNVLSFLRSHQTTKTHKAGFCLTMEEFHPRIIQFSIGT